MIFLASSKPWLDSKVQAPCPGHKQGCGPGPGSGSGGSGSGSSSSGPGPGSGPAPGPDPGPGLDPDPDSGPGSGPVQNFPVWQGIQFLIETEATG